MVGCPPATHIGKPERQAFVPRRDGFNYLSTASCFTPDLERSRNHRWLELNEIEHKGPMLCQVLLVGLPFHKVFSTRVRNDSLHEPWS